MRFAWNFLGVACLLMAIWIPINIIRTFPGEFRRLWPGFLGFPLLMLGLATVCFFAAFKI